MKCRWNRTMLNLCGIVAAILKMATGRNFSMSGINLGHHNLPTCLYIWNVIEIGQCWICAELWWPFWKWRLVEIFQCQESIRDIIIYPHIKFDDIGQCWIFATILKMATARNFSMSGIYSGHHNLPTYEMSLKSDNVEFVQYCGGHFENGDR